MTPKPKPKKRSEAKKKPTFPHVRAELTVDGMKVTSPRLTRREVERRRADNLATVFPNKAMEEAYAALLAADEALDAVDAWDRKWPKGRLYPADSKRSHEKELDEAVAKVRAARLPREENSE